MSFRRLIRFLKNACLYRSLSCINVLCYLYIRLISQRRHMGLDPFPVCRHSRPFPPLVIQDQDAAECENLVHAARERSHFIASDKPTLGLFLYSGIRLMVCADSLWSRLNDPEICRHGSRQQGFLR